MQPRTYVQSPRAVRGVPLQYQHPSSEMHAEGAALLRPSNLNLLSQPQLSYCPGH